MGSRHLVAAGEAGDGARFAALVAPTFAPVRVRPLVDGTFHSSVRSAAAATCAFRWWAAAPASSRGTPI